MEKTRIISSAIIALGLAVCGISLPIAVKEYRALDRTVTVKGLCEREGAADKAIWPITFRNMDNESITSLTRKIDNDKKLILDFLTREGIGEDEITINAPVISDKLSMSYGVDRAYRFVSKSVITVCTSKVDKVLELNTKISELLKSGVLIGSENEW